MTISEQRAIETLVADHVPLVGYAVTELTGRLPQAARPEALVAAGVDGLRAAAHSYKSNPQGATDFARYAKPRIAAALSASLASSDVAAPAPPLPATDVAQVVGLLRQLEPALGTDEELLLHAAHRAAFAGEPQRPPRGTGHYASVAAASAYRSTLAAHEGSVADLQRKFGA